MTEVVLSPRTLREIEGRLRVRFRAFLRPGEKIALSVEDEEDFVYAQLLISSRDETFQLDLEAAVIEQDQEEGLVRATTSAMRLLAAIEYLSSQAEEFFRSQRRARYHVDWRIYDCEGARVRFRGQQRRPDLEAQATDLLGDEEPP